MLKDFDIELKYFFADFINSIRQKIVPYQSNLLQ